MAHDEQFVLDSKRYNTQETNAEIDSFKGEGSAESDPATKALAAEAVKQLSKTTERPLRDQQAKAPEEPQS